VVEAGSKVLQPELVVWLNLERATLPGSAEWNVRGRLARLIHPRLPFVFGNTAGRGSKVEHHYGKGACARSGSLQDGGFEIAHLVAIA
jgi:hypothetical protein